MYYEALAVICLQLVVDTSAPWACVEAFFIVFPSLKLSILLMTYFYFLMQVLNGLLSRDDFEVAIQFPIGIIPAGSDNSLVWTVLGIRDPVSAAIALAKVPWLCHVYLFHTRSYYQGFL